MQEHVVAVDIGGTSMVLAAVTPQGDILDRLELPSAARQGGDKFTEIIAETTMSRWPGAAAIGVGTAGTVQPGTGTIIAAGDTFSNWVGYPFGAQLTGQTGKPVSVINDVNAFLLGEAQYGAAKGRDDCLAIMLGTGVGGALLVDGTVVNGRRGAAGEIGHMPGFGDRPCTCGGTGHLETLAGGRAIARRFARAADLPEDSVTARTVALAASNGDTRAQRIFSDAGTAVGLAIAMTATMLDLDMVVLGGGVLKSWTWLAPGIHDTLARYPLVSGAELTVIRSELNGDAVLLGAAASALPIRPRRPDSAAARTTQGVEEHPLNVAAG